MLGLLDNPTGYEDLGGFILNVVDIAIETSAVIAVVALLIAGFKYILAMGDEQKIEDATRSLVFALVGLVIVFLAPLVVRYIISTVLTQ